MGDSNNKMEQIKALTNCKGIQYLINEAYKILGNPILIHNMEYKVIAYNENIITDDPIWSKSITTGKIDHDELLYIKDECFYERALNTKKIIFLRSDELKYDRMFGKLFTTNNMQVGYACMVACNKPFEDGDSELFEAVCDILNKELFESEYYQNYGQAYLEALVSKIIEGRLEDSNFISHIESIYMGLKGLLRLSVVDTSCCDLSRTRLVYLRDMFKQARPDFKYVIYSDYILGLSSTDYNALDIEAIVKLYNIFEQNNLYAGISDYFENILELPKYYNQAVNALINGLKDNSNQRIFPHSEI